MTKYFAKPPEGYPIGSSDYPKTGDGPVIKRAGMKDQGARPGTTVEASRFGQKLSNEPFKAVDQIPDKDGKNPEEILLEKEDGGDL